MVLGARNFSKRHVKENTPPSKSVDAITQRVTASLREAARRRRRRVSGSQNIQIEPVQKREQRTRPALHFRVVKTQQSQATHIQDAVMTDTSRVASPTVPFTVPRRLLRPAYKPISPEALAAAAPGIESVDYLLETLPFLSNEMLRGVLGVKPPVIHSNSIPTEMEIDISSLSNADIPTHLLAIYTQPPTKPGEQPVVPTITGKVMLHPVHNVMLAAHCANLPPLASSEVTVVPTPSGGAKVTLPVKPLGVPVPEFIPLITTYLYSKRPLSLLSALLPAGCPIPAALHPGARFSPAEKTAALREFSQRMAQTYTPRALVECLHRINAVWRNVCALGIFDVAVWEPMDIAWEIVLSSLAIATNQPELMNPKPSHT